MNKTKPLWQSRTVIAAVVGLTATTLDVFGVQIGDREAVTHALFKIIEGGAFLTALWGRLVAKKRLVP